MLTGLYRVKAGKKSLRKLESKKVFSHSRAGIGTHSGPKRAEASLFVEKKTRGNETRLDLEDSLHALKEGGRFEEKIVEEIKSREQGVSFPSQYRRVRPQRMIETLNCTRGSRSIPTSKRGRGSSEG